MQITKGEGKEGRIYERLRKRSYRKHLRNERMWEEYFAWEDEQDWDNPSEPRPPIPSPDYHEGMHKAYVAGLRDALTDAAKGDTVGCSWVWV